MGHGREYFCLLQLHKLQSQTGVESLLLGIPGLIQHVGESTQLWTQARNPVALPVTEFVL